MQYVNDDMDDLFRRAAKDYPLNTSGSDWNKVAAALVDSEGKPAPEKKKRSFLWFLMLVPLSMICHLYISPENIIRNGASRNNASENKNNVTAAVSTGVTGKSITINDPSESHSITALPKSRMKTDHFRKLAGSRIKVSAKDDEQNSTFNPPSDQLIITEAASDKMLHSIPVSNKNKSSLQPLNPFASSIVMAAPSDIPSRLKQKRFYAGIMGGIDASTVKFQKVEDLGYDAGILAGYELNKKWSVEGGFFLARKFYYTKAEYFDESKINYMPANSWITEVAGNCSMFEIPLAVKFNIVRNKKSDWFTTAGVSSYIMKNEDYSYVYYYATPAIYATHKRSYKNSSVDLFSVLTFSAGYTHHIGKLTDIRFEPYVKLPVSGMGFGNLPLISGGFHAGITRKLF
jgi:hypothetical protein